LDNKEDKEYIKQQVYELKIKAKAQGFAIGIGHDRRATLEVLREVMPELAKEGYKFIFISELVK
ncbi:MAG: divergent polysaccharide deacetylase family protein, partial [Candidatus Omnitrophica bacterium]|nr:divergent polysaccharide deacetylase family protein [Candidatus Omnitrophota bacterium]